MTGKTTTSSSTTLVVLASSMHTATLARVRKLLWGRCSNSLFKGEASERNVGYIKCTHLNMVLRYVIPTHCPCACIYDIGTRRR